MMKKAKQAAALFIGVLVMLIMAGCGPAITTKMEFDGAFSGSRSITVNFDSSNGGLDDIDGGMATVLDVVQKNLPAGMTFEQEGDKSLVFNLAFTSLEDYRSKVQTILNTKDSAVKEPAVEYLVSDSIFKTGVYFKENFNSHDLLMWLDNAMYDSGKVTHTDRSDWYSLSETAVVIDGTTYKTDSCICVDTTKNNCFDRCLITTSLLADGTYARTVEFGGDSEMEQEIEKQGNNLTEFMTALTPDGVAFEQDNEDEDETVYRYSFSSADAAQIEKNTASILQTENCVFTVDIQADPTQSGHAAVQIEDACDSTYFTRSDDGGALLCVYSLYPNSCLVSSQADVSNNNTSIVVEPEQGVKNTIQLDWLVSLSECTIALVPQRKDNATVEISFAIPQAMPTEIAQIAVSSLKDAAGELAQTQETAEALRFTFSGTATEISDGINTFIANFNGVSSQDQTNCTFLTTQQQSVSKLKDTWNYSFSANLSGMLGNEAQVKVHLGEFETVSPAAVVHYQTTIISWNIISVILLIVFCGMVAAGTIFAGLSVKTYRLGIAAVKTRFRRNTGGAKPMCNASTVQPVSAPLQEKEQNKTGTQSNVDGEELL